MFIRLFTATVTVILLASEPAWAQMFTDFKPGGTIPKDGYTPDPNKVMYVLFWHHKKRTNEFDHRAYYMNDDGVNNTTADKMKKMIEERYPNLAVYVKETNERDIRTVIEREQKRIKFIEKDWVDLKQPEKIEPPKMLGRARFGYDETRVKEPADASVAGTTWQLEENQSVHYLFEKEGVFRLINTTENQEKKTSKWKQEGRRVTIEWIEGRSNVIGIIGEDDKMSIECQDGEKVVWKSSLRLKK